MKENKSENGNEDEIEKKNERGGEDISQSWQHTILLSIDVDIKLASN